MVDEPLSFMARLKRHHIFRVATVYAVAAYILIQACNAVFPDIGLSRADVRFIIVAAALLFPVVMVLGWMLISPSKQDPTQFSRWQKLRWRLGSVLSLVIIVLVTISGVLLWRANARHTEAEQVIAMANVPPITPAPAATTVTPAKSVAVLPFENLSADKANAYFASGMQDMILTKLADIGDLKVIARSSMMQYSSHPEDLKTIGQQLGVATVLEGSVQKAGNQVLINVQLINVNNASHLWAGAYTRSLDNIFNVEGEVAEKVAAALEAKLTAAEQARVAAVPTTDAAAFSLYLRANAHANLAYDQLVLAHLELPQAITLYQQALAHDPHFALAAAAMAVAQIFMYWNGPDRTEARLAATKAAADQALALEPGLGLGEYAMALYYYWGHRDYVTALRYNELARKAMPNNSDVEAFGAFIARRQGQWSKAIASLQQVTALDPRSAINFDQLAITYALLRRYADADAAFVRALAVTPNPDDELATRGQIRVFWNGDLKPLGVALKGLTPGTDAYIGNARLFFWYDWWSRDYVAAINKAQTDAVAGWSDNSSIALPRQLFLAWAYAAAGDSAYAKQNYSAVEVRTRATLIQQPGDAELHLALAFADAGLGLKDAALREAHKAIELMPTSHDAYTGAAMLGFVAQLYVRVGDNTQAIKLLQHLMAMPAGLSVSLALLKIDPIWDPLRNDPHFQALLKKYENTNESPVTSGG